LFTKIKTTNLYYVSIPQDECRIDVSLGWLTTKVRINSTYGARRSVELSYLLTYLLTYPVGVEGGLTYRAHLSRCRWARRTSHDSAPSRPGGRPPPPSDLPYIIQTQIQHTGNTPDLQTLCTGQISCGADDICRESMTPRSVIVSLVQSARRRPKRKVPIQCTDLSVLRRNQINQFTE